MEIVGYIRDRTGVTTAATKCPDGPPQTTPHGSHPSATGRTLRNTHTRVADPTRLLAPGIGFCAQTLSSLRPPELTT